MKKYIKIPDSNNTIIIRGFIFGIEKPNWNLHEDYHDIFELTLCVEGSALEWINDTCIEFNKGDWIFLNPGIRHRTFNQSQENFSYMAIHFDIDDLNLRKLLKNSKLNHIPFLRAKQTDLEKYTIEIDKIIQKMISHKNYKLDEENIILTMTEVEKLLFQANILSVISEYMQLAEQDCEKQQSNSISKQQLEIAYKIEALLEQRVFGYLDMDELSKVVGYSRSHCTRIFNNVYGSSPRQYHSTLKLKKAKELLLLSQKSIEDISNELGFSSVYHFSRQFKRWTSKSPTEYRMKPQKS